jgi:Poxvirus A32 protein
MSKETAYVSEFDAKFITKGAPCITLTGHRRSGKSVILKEFMYYLHSAGVPRCCVFSGTEGANKYFSGFVPGVFIHSLDNMSKLETVFKSQKDMFEKKEFGLIPADTDLRLVLVMDDLAFNEKLMRSRILKEIFFNGRHYEITLIQLCSTSQACTHPCVVM